MPNKNYVNGRHKEYKIVNELKRQGYEIAQRTAGSHSPIDIFAVNRQLNKIKFIQSKPNNFSERKHNEIMKELDWLNKAEFTVEFEII